MVIMNNLTYVTCLYDNLFGTYFGGRENPSLRYYYSLETLSSMADHIVVYTWTSDVSKIETYLIDFLGLEQFKKQIKVIGFDLDKSPLYEIIKSIKTDAQGINNDRSYDLTISKFLFIKDTFEKNYFNSDYIYWIDVGLSHSSLFPFKHIDQSDKYRRYSRCELFTSKIGESLIKESSDKIILFKLLGSMGHFFDSNFINIDLLNINLKSKLPWYIIGGIFGGRKEKVYEFSNKIIDRFIKLIKDRSLLLLEEQVMTFEVIHNEYDYNYIEFDSWYHEDSGDWVANHIIGKKLFYHIFEKFNL